MHTFPRRRASPGSAAACRKLPSSDEEGWRSERRGGAERLVRLPIHAPDPHAASRQRGPPFLRPVLQNHRLRSYARPRPNAERPAPHKKAAARKTGGRSTGCPGWRIRFNVPVCTQNKLSFAQNELVGEVKESGGTGQPHPRTNPSPVVLRLEKTPEPDTLPRERALSRGGEAQFHAIG